MAMVMKGIRPPRPPNTDRGFSDPMWNLVEACWSQKKEERPSADAVVGKMSNVIEAH